MFKDIFLQKKRKYAEVKPSVTTQDKTGNIPEDMWRKCPDCKSIVYKRSLVEGRLVCPKCNYHFRLNAWERIGLIADDGSFNQFDFKQEFINPIDFPNYEEKIKANQEKTSLDDAVVCGQCKINGADTVICIMDSHFMMGSMGYKVGESITKSVEYATEKRLPIIIFTTSGGARMQEGIVSLMQMAKVSAALAKHGNEGLLYVTVLTDPTTGGVTASFAMLGDIIISEPKALIGFAGKRVIEQTIKQDLPENFQTAEFLLERGFIDMIVERKDLKNTLGKILYLHKEVQ